MYNYFEAREKIEKKRGKKEDFLFNTKATSLCQNNSFNSKVTM